MLHRLLPFLLIAATANCVDWPQWRGPGRDGNVTAEPKSWPEKLQPKWKIEVGEGHSSPILADGKIFVFARQNGNEVMTAADPASGKKLWQQSYAAPYKMNPAAVKHGEGPKSTPVFADGRVYALGIQGALSCFDAKTGRVIWRKDFAASPAFGTAMSPVVDGGFLIAHVGGHDKGGLTAFDAATGAVKWRWDGDGPAYASPVIAELAGARQVITQSEQAVVGVSEKSGELLWRMAFNTLYQQNSVTPLVYRDTLILGGLSNPTVAMRIEKKGSAYTPVKLWQNAELTLYMSTPVLRGDRLYGFSNRNKGQFFVMDARTGATLWTGEPRQGDNAAVLTGRDNLYLLKDDAELTVAAVNGNAIEPRRHYTLADAATWAHPVILDNGVLVKDFRTLGFWSIQ